MPLVPPLRLAENHAVMLIMPLTRKIIPMATVIHVTVCSRYFTNNAPMTMAHKARKTLLRKTFIINSFAVSSKVLYGDAVISRVKR